MPIFLPVRKYLFPEVPKAVWIVATAVELCSLIAELKLKVLVDFTCLNRTKKLSS